MRVIEHPLLKENRDKLRAAGRCICGPAVGNVSKNGTLHGPVLRSGKCARCLSVWRGLHVMSPRDRVDLAVRWQLRELKQIGAAP